MKENAEAIIDENREIHVKIRMDLLTIAEHDFELGTKACKRLV